MQPFYTPFTDDATIAVGPSETGPRRRGGGGTPPNDVPAAGRNDGGGREGPISGGATASTVGAVGRCERAKRRIEWP